MGSPLPDATARRGVEGSNAAVANSTPSSWKFGPQPLASWRGTRPLTPATRRPGVEGSTARNDTRPSIRPRSALDHDAPLSIEATIRSAALPARSGPSTDTAVHEPAGAPLTGCHVAAPSSLASRPPAVAA